MLCKSDANMPIAVHKKGGGTYTGLKVHRDAVLKRG